MGYCKIEMKFSLEQEAEMIPTTNNRIKRFINRKLKMISITH